MDAYPGYLGLLKWSLAQTDPAVSDHVHPMAEEDKKWLQDAMTAFTIDEGKRMKELLEVLRRPESSGAEAGGGAGGEAGSDAVSSASEDVVAAKESAFDELMILIETIDNSRDMVKMGGLGPVSACLASAAPSLRAMAAETLATALQNNPAVQQMAASANLLAVFLPMVARDPDITVRTKALLALSAYVRDNAPAAHAFLARDGLSVVLACVTTEESPRLQRRAVFFLRHLVASSSCCSTHAKSALLHGCPALLPVLGRFAAGDDPVLREDALGVFAEFLGASEEGTGEAVEGTGAGASGGAAGAGVGAGAGAGSSAGPTLILHGSAPAVPSGPGSFSGASDGGGGGGGGGGGSTAPRGIPIRLAAPGSSSVTVTPLDAGAGAGASSLPATALPASAAPALAVASASTSATATGFTGRGLAEVPASCTTLAVAEPPVDFARVLKSDPPLAERAAAVLASPVSLREVAAARLAAARADPEFGEMEASLCATILEALGTAGAV